MTLFWKRIFIALLALALVAPAIRTAHADTYSQAQLDQMLAPVALYPDPLLSQVLMAATYPIEVVEAARWSRANPHLKGDDAVRAVQDQDWDPSVKSLVAFPQLLQRMDQNIAWTRSLGDAFLEQQPHVMDTVQQLRRRAHAAGNLRSSDQVQVRQDGEVIVVQPARPTVVYVPYYDPVVVYGPWWHAAYPPVVWAPWPGYVRPGVSVSFWWGAPIAVSTGFFFGRPDWHRRHVHVHHVQHVHYHHRDVAPGAWRHDPHHRRGVEYRSPAVRQQFVSAPARSQDRDDRSQVLSRPARAQQQPVQQQAQPQPQAQPQRPRIQQEERRAQRERPQAQPQQQRQVQPQVQPQPQVQAQPRPQPQAQQPQRPRVQQQEERREQRAEKREQRIEKREPRAEPRQQQRRDEARSERGRKNGNGERG